MSPYINRLGTLAHALASVGARVDKSNFIREPKMRTLTRDRNDRDNTKPSVYHMIRPSKSVPGAFGNGHMHGRDYDRALAAVSRAA